MSVLVDGGGTHDSFDYVDGYGRSLGSKVEAADGRWRLLEATEYNRRGLPAKKWLPYDTLTSDFETPDDAESRRCIFRTPHVARAGRPVENETVNWLPCSKSTRSIGSCWPAGYVSYRLNFFDITQCE